MYQTLKNAFSPSRVGYTDFYPHPIQSGTEYDKLIPEPKGIHNVKFESGSTYDTVKLIKQIGKNSKGQTAKLAKRLKAESLEESAANIENFLQNHIPYRYDGGNNNGRKPTDEELVYPARLWHNRRKKDDPADCDDYSIFASSLLNNMSINHAIRKADYGNGYQHVYVIVPKNQNTTNTENLNRDEYLVIDPVIQGINNEKPFHKIHDTMSRITTLAGFGHTGFGAPTTVAKNNKSSFHTPGPHNSFSNFTQSGLGNSGDAQQALEDANKIIEETQTIRDYWRSLTSVFSIRDGLDLDNTELRGSEDQRVYNEFTAAARATPKGQAPRSWQARYGAYMIMHESRCLLPQSTIDNDFNTIQNDVTERGGSYVRNRRGVFARLFKTITAERARRLNNLPCVSGHIPFPDSPGNNDPDNQWNPNPTPPTPPSPPDNDYRDPGAGTPSTAGFGKTAGYIAGGVLLATGLGFMLKKSGALGNVGKSNKFEV